MDKTTDPEDMRRKYSRRYLGPHAPQAGWHLRTSRHTVTKTVMHSHWSFLRCYAFFAVLLLPLLPGTLQARAGTASVHMFDLASQPLASALEAFGVACGVQLLYESDIVGVGYAPSLRGEYTIDEALRMLLAGTDFVVREVRANVITIARSDREAMLLPPPTVLGTPDLSLDTLRIRGDAEMSQEAVAAYGLTVQSDVQSALGRRDSTRFGNYIVGVGLWISPSRAVQRLEILRSSGNNERDAAVLAVLRNLVISKATPDHLPQPVRVTIRVSSQ